METTLSMELDDAIVTDEDIKISQSLDNILNGLLLFGIGMGVCGFIYNLIVYLN